MFELRPTRIAPVTIHPMEYRAIMAAGLAPIPPAADTPSPKPEELAARIRELEQELEEWSRSIESAIQTARIEAREAGRNSERTEHASRIATATQALTAALDGFLADRDRYLAQVEQEVVRLALAIAARVLHRESLMDPLLLSGAVRVALGQLAETTEVRLKIPASEYQMWREMLHLMPNLPLRPEVIVDDALTTGECLLETHLGSVDLGVRSQLAEIERGFFDLLEHRNQRCPLEHAAESAASQPAR
jgi:flagellar assembly protein FliH